MTEDKPQLLASPAPVVDEVDDMPTGAEELIQQKDLDMLCNAWSSWVRSRRLYVKPSAPVSLLGKLTTKSSGRSQSDGPNAIASAELMAFHLALLGQPAEALEVQISWFFGQGSTPPAEEIVRVRVLPAWLRIDARFGSLYRRRGDPAVVLR